MLGLTWKGPPAILRDDLYGLVALFAVVFATFAPFAFGGLSLEESSTAASSLFRGGSTLPPNGNISVARVLDAGAPAWLTEPLFPLEGSIIKSERALPIWNPYAGFGMPLMADMQSQPLDPITWLPILCSSARAYSLWIVIRLYLASALAFLFLRKFMSTIPAVGGGIAFAFSGYFLMFITMPELSVNILIPLLLLAIESLLRKPGPLSTAGLASTVALTIFGGMPESEAILLGFGVLYAIARAFSDSTVGASCAAIAKWGFLGFGLGLGSAAVLLLPFLEYVAHSFSIHVASDPSRWQGLASDALDIRTLSTYLAPLVLGPPENDIFSKFSGFTGSRDFFGAAVVSLACAAAFSRATSSFPQRGALPIRFFAITSIVLLLKRFGIQPIQWLGALPVLRSIQFNKYEEPVLAFCVAILAASAIDRIATRQMRFQSVLVGASFVLGILFMLIDGEKGAFALLDQGRDYYSKSLALALGTLALVLGAAFVAHFRQRTARGVAVFIVIVVAAAPIAGYIVPMYYVVDQSARDETAAIAGAPYTRFLQAQATPDGRLYGQDQMLYPNWSSAFHLNDVRALDALYPDRYFPFINTFLSLPDKKHEDRFTGSVRLDFKTERERRFVQISAIRFIVRSRQGEQFDHFVKASSAIPPSALRTGRLVAVGRLNSRNNIDADSTVRQMYDDGKAVIDEVKHPTSRLAFFTNVIQVLTPAESLAKIGSRKFDPSETVVVENLSQSPAASHSSLVPTPELAQKINDVSTTDLESDVDAPTPGILLLRDTDYPGWIATVDGSQVPIFQGDYLFRAVELPAGKHHVAFLYRPMSVTAGSVLTIASGVCVLALTGFGLGRRTRPAGTCGSRGLLSL